MEEKYTILKTEDVNAKQRIKNIDLYSTLLAYGDVIELTPRIAQPEEFVEWSERNFEYVRYNPRKDINRWGLSITSLDGGLSGLPDLDSVLEYNRDHGTNYNERDFKVPTPVYEQNADFKKNTRSY